METDKKYEELIHRIKVHNISAPDDLLLKIKSRIEKPVSPFYAFRVQLAALSLFLVVAIGLYESYELNPDVQANRFLKESVQNNIYADYAYFHTGTF